MFNKKIAAIKKPRYKIALFVQKGDKTPREKLNVLIDDGCFFSSRIVGAATEQQQIR
jgi:acetyl-CoA carboxylase carboxyltransferase component